MFALPAIFLYHVCIDLIEHSAWIGSLQYALVLLPAVAVGRIFDLGHFRVPFFLGSVALVVGMFLVAECKEYWQFLLVHGILVGVHTFLHSFSRLRH